MSLRMFECLALETCRRGLIQIRGQTLRDMLKPRDSRAPFKQCKGSETSLPLPRIAWDVIPHFRQAMSIQKASAITDSSQFSARQHKQSSHSIAQMTNTTAAPPRPPRRASHAVVGHPTNKLAYDPACRPHISKRLSYPTPTPQNSWDLPPKHHHPYMSPLKTDGKHVPPPPDTPPLRSCLKGSSMGYMSPGAMSPDLGSEGFYFGPTSRADGRPVQRRISSMREVSPAPMPMPTPMPGKQQQQEVHHVPQNNANQAWLPHHAPQGPQGMQTRQAPPSRRHSSLVPTLASPQPRAQPDWRDSPTTVTQHRPSAPAAPGRRRPSFKIDLPPRLSYPTASPSLTIASSREIDHSELTFHLGPRQPTIAEDSADEEPEISALPKFIDPFATASTPGGFMIIRAPTNKVGEREAEYTEYCDPKTVVGEPHGFGYSLNKIRAPTPWIRKEGDEGAWLNERDMRETEARVARIQV